MLEGWTFLFETISHLFLLLLHQLDHLCVFFTKSHHLLALWLPYLFHLAIFICHHVQLLLSNEHTWNCLDQVINFHLWSAFIALALFLGGFEVRSLFLLEARRIILGGRWWRFITVISENILCFFLWILGWGWWSMILLKSMWPFDTLWLCFSWLRKWRFWLVHIGTFFLNVRLLILIRWLRDSFLAIILIAFREHSILRSWPSIFSRGNRFLPL